MSSQFQYKTKKDAVKASSFVFERERDCQSPVPATRLAFDPSGLRSLRSRQAQNLPPRACAHESNYAAPLLGSSSSSTIKKKTTFVGGFSFLEREKGMIRRQSPVLRHGLTPHPKGLFACAQSPKFFPRATPTKEFSRPLFSGPRPDYDIKKRKPPW